jgi:tetratricopeptide (TPR) repeat protein
MRLSLGTVYFMAGEPESAVRAYRNALELSPDALPLLLWTGLAELAAGNRDAALEMLQLTDERMQPNSRLFRALLARAYADLDRPQDVERIVAEVRQLESAGRAGGAIWAHLHIASGDYESAISSLEEAIDTREPLDVAMSLLGWAAYGDPFLASDARWVEARSRIATSDQ